jgi:hypothetical protein
MTKLLSQKTITRAKLGARFSTALALLLSALVSTHAQASQPSSQKYHIVVANLTDKSLDIKIKKTEGKPCKSLEATLAMGETKDYWDMSCKLKYLKVGTRTILSRDPEKSAMFLIELDESGHGFMVTPFVSDAQGWQEWAIALQKAKAKLYAKKSADLQAERDQALAQESERYRAVEATFDLEAEMAYGPGSGNRMMYTEQRETHRLNKLAIENKYSQGMAQIAQFKQ